MKAGSCPKCGMDMVKANAQGGHNNVRCKMTHRKMGIIPAGREDVG